MRVGYNQQGVFMSEIDKGIPIFNGDSQEKANLSNNEIQKIIREELSGLEGDEKISAKRHISGILYWFEGNKGLIDRELVSDLSRAATLFPDESEATSQIFKTLNIIAQTYSEREVKESVKAINNFPNKPEIITELTKAFEHWTWGGILGPLDKEEARKQIIFTSVCFQKGELKKAISLPNEIKGLTKYATQIFTSIPARPGFEDIVPELAKTVVTFQNKPKAAVETAILKLWRFVQFNRTPEEIIEFTKEIDQEK